MFQILTNPFRGLEKKALNEGVFSKIGGAIKRFLQKIGKFFWFLNPEGQAEPVIVPVNVGIMTKGKMIMRIQ